MSQFQKGLVAGAGIFLLLTLIAGAGLGVWWLNSGTPGAAATNPNEPVAQTSPTPLANANTDTTNPNLNPNTNATLPARGTPPAGIAPGAPGRLAGSFGIVREVGEDTIVVTDGRETETIYVGNQTLVVFCGKPNATLDDIQPGDKLLAVGPLRGDRTNARLVLVTPAAYTNANIFMGQIASVKGNTLLITTRQGDRTVTTDAQTRMVNQELGNTANANLAAGLQVIVIGQPTASGFTAEVVLSQPQRAPQDLQPPKPPPTATPAR